jgi:hypothetical protein
MTIKTLIDKLSRFDTDSEIELFDNKGDQVIISDIVSVDEKDFDHGLIQISLAQVTIDNIT